MREILNDLDRWQRQGKRVAIDGAMRLAHPAQRTFKIGVVARRGVAPPRAPVDPLAHPRGVGHMLLTLLANQGKLDALYENLTADPIGETRGKAQRDLAAERMPDEVELRELQSIDQLGEIADIPCERVVAIGRPTAVAVPAKVGRDDAAMRR